MSSEPNTHEARKSEEVFQRLGTITRQLHDALNELGYTPVLKGAVDELPDARSRLKYIARLTGEAAEKVLNRVDEAKAEQERVIEHTQQLLQTIRGVPGLKWAMPEPLQVVPGKRGFENFCVACHGVDGKGNQAVGAPNLTDNVWLFGSSEASIVNTILNGRENIMPAQNTVLTPDQIRLLTAWVWGLSNPAGSTAAK